jgi:hypothetical protein
LTDDEALQLEQEIEKVCVISFIRTLMWYLFTVCILMQQRAALSGMRLASASVLFYTLAIIGDVPFTRADTN